MSIKLLTNFTKLRSIALGILAISGAVSGASVPASASVEYTFQAPSDQGEDFAKKDFLFLGDSFDLTTPNFITTTSTFTGEESGCTVFLSTCTSVSFSPAASQGDDDVLTITYGFLQLAKLAKLDVDPPFSDFQSDTFTFAPGTFGKTGTFYSGDEFQGELTITSSGMSPVPLPASAPMFGAALLALGAVGYGMKRKAKAA